MAFIFQFVNVVFHIDWFANVEESLHPWDKAHLDMILYTENPKDSTRKLLELINEYSKVAGCKINTQKSFAFLYTNNEKTEGETKETIPFTIAMKRIKYLGIYLPKETKSINRKL